ncbi:dTDP-4-dehydrorhamnose 3,5-epimerase family protein [Polynucleobacter necessarius]|uniref:dTDP-4-dehydrorhamnose 3,5-epimerase family protein n=1 Tax=Polynucleobacter necessarius TaxID=576610 RepID=UPI000E0933E0|nr:dTDP-4-dehydrorhamnose 3,5-epimerase family protein [Polynucleobacter necessarius]
MRVELELLSGCYLIKCDAFEDLRGTFVKTYHENLYRKLGISFTMREEYYSASKKDVIRGMHFQSPPFDHEKIVSCIRGSVLDVLLDLRQGNSYGATASVRLSGEGHYFIYIPKGIAHGFLSLESDSLMIYKTSTIHMPDSDLGIRWNSFDFNWGLDDPILSPRDQQHVPFDKFQSPF